MHILGKSGGLEALLSRRGFLGFVGKVVSAFIALPVLKSVSPGAARVKKGAAAAAKKTVMPEQGGRLLLKNGLVVDGTGAKGYQGSVLINGDRIEKVSPGDIAFDGEAIDCRGMVISPGFIDAHSHFDWYLPVPGHDGMKTPFTAQGITTFIAGQCGWGVAGYRKNSAFMNLNEARTKDWYKIQWTTMAEYFDHIRKQGMSHNLVNFAGHGYTRTSIRGYDASPMKPEEMKEMLGLLEEAMDQGAAGVSFGLQYEPGIFATGDEIREIAKLIKRKNKVLSVHLRAYSALSPGYPMSTGKILIDHYTPFQGYTPHNILAVDEMLDIARKTGVRLQISHLIFVGEKTFKSYEESLAHIDKAIKEGVDVKFDTYSYHCGQSHINVVFPAWFLAKVPEAFSDQKMLSKLKSELGLIVRFLGFGTEDIQITYANSDELNQYNGMFIQEIAEKQGKDWFGSLIDIAKKSNGRAAVLNHRYSNMEIIEALMRHPASLFMTDALPSTEGVQNPASYGGFPRFFQLAREKKLITLEEVVYKMSGASVERFSIKDRGLLKEGLAADITMFNQDLIKDNNTVKETSMAPSGIEAVFINGKRVFAGGKVDAKIKSGAVVT